MVLWYKSQSQYDYGFHVVTYSWLNRYPNPFAKHIVSVDTLDNSIDEDGNLHITKLIRKTGSLPAWAQPFLKSISGSWIIEKAVINPNDKTMKTYTRNLDHTAIIRIEEFNDYNFDNLNEIAFVESKVMFSSGFKQLYGFSIKDRIENWSHNKFAENIKRSRQGLILVMKHFKQNRLSNDPVADVSSLSS